jgi:hypothetical protein
MMMMMMMMLMMMMMMVMMMMMMMTMVMVVHYIQTSTKLMISTITLHHYSTETSPTGEHT